MSTQRRTLLETETSLAPAAVLAAAQKFFATRNTLYAAFVEQESATHISLRGQGGEEIVIGARATPSGGSSVSGASYLFDAQISRFLATLPPIAGGAA